MKPISKQPDSADFRQQLRNTPVAGQMKRLLAVLATGLLVSCSTTPPQLRLHSLLSSDARFTDSASARSFGDPIRLVIAPVGVPAGVNQPQWLVRRADDSLQLLEQDRWAAPLADEFRTAIRAHLGSRWGVVDGSSLRGADVPDTPSWRLVLEVVHLEARPSRDVLLEARWTVLSPQAAATGSGCNSRLVEPVHGDGSLPIAEAYRQAVLRLSDQIGAFLRSGQRSSPAGCGNTRLAGGQSGLQ